ncbi:hypothetical protein [Pseudomonas parafulva]|uniref:hypothetical protein n=1 Tax=Pseudomonas parafulva TaxID=157782 RepID=UPI000A466D55|nr:hypothetical protein [Pseudomonas parafulva]
MDNRTPTPENPWLALRKLTPVSYIHLRAHKTGRKIVCRLMVEKKQSNTTV